MRKLFTTMALIGLLAGAVAAQFRMGMMGGPQSGDALLANKSVQDELKLTDAQKKEVAEIAKKSGEAMREAFPLFREDREKAMEIMKKAQDEAAKGYKKVREGLTSIQAKRFAEVEVQVAVKNNDSEFFKRPDIVKALSLTDKQQVTIKDSLTELGKDLKEIQDELKDNPGGFREAMPKMQKLRQGTFEKITKSFTADQKKAFKEMQGSAFDFKPDTPFGKGKGKKKDDF